MSRKEFKTVLVEKGDHSELKDIATSENRTISQQISYWIKQYRLSQPKTA